MSPEQAAVIVDAIERLPLAEHVRRRGEQLLLEEADRLNATDLHRAGRHLAQVVDPDGDEREAEKALDREDRAAHLGRFLTITDDGCGGVRVKGRGTVEDGAILRAALLPLTKPVPTIDPDDLCGVARPPRPRRPDVGRPGRHRPALPDHRPRPGQPRRPAPGRGHHRPPTPSVTPAGHRGGGHRRRPRAERLRRTPDGV